MRPTLSGRVFPLCLRRTGAARSCPASSQAVAWGGVAGSWIGVEGRGLRLTQSGTSSLTETGAQQLVVGGGKPDVDPDLRPGVLKRDQVQLPHRLARRLELANLRAPRVPKQHTGIAVAQRHPNQVPHHKPPRLDAGLLAELIAGRLAQQRWPAHRAVPREHVGGRPVVDVGRRRPIVGIEVVIVEVQPDVGMPPQRIGRGQPVAPVTDAQRRQRIGDADRRDRVVRPDAGQSTISFSSS